MKSISEKPIFFEKNRVWRVYTGGALFAALFGDNSVDGFEPEEWIASSVRAINKESNGEKEGVSRVKDTEVYFDDLLQEYPKEMLGDRKEFGILIKLLDSAIRLPIQAHPDKAFSRKYFNSEYGKTESWIVLETRPGAALYFGFKEKISKKDFARAVAASETDKTVMEPLLNKVAVKPGDVFLVPARMVHAIGQGCLILEIQEPTDFTIQPEYWCGEYHLNEQEMYIGLDSDIALDIFDYDTCGEEAVKKGRCNPKVLEQTDSCMVEELVSYEDTPCFAVRRYSMNGGELKLKLAPAVYVVTEGAGKIFCDSQSWELKKGDYFFLPYAAKEKTVLRTDGNLQIIVCLPPMEQKNMQLKLFHKGFNYSQDGKGNRLVYHLQACNLCCPWCANPEGMDAEGPDTFTMTIDEMIDEIVRSKPMYFDGGGVTFTGGEATCQFDVLKELLVRLKELGISTTLETNGTSARLPELFPFLDELIMDFKHYDSAIHKQVMGLGNEIIKKNIERAFAEHANVLVRIPLIGNVNADEKDIEEFVKFFKQFAYSNVRFELLCYHEYGKEKWTRCGKEYKVKNAFVTEETRIAFENKMRMHGLHIVRT